MATMTVIDLSNLGARGLALLTNPPTVPVDKGFLEDSIKMPDLTGILEKKLDTWFDEKIMAPIIAWLGDKWEAVTTFCKVNGLQFITVAAASYLVYVGLRMLIFSRCSEKDMRDIYIDIVLYTMLRLIWKTSFGI